jgi:CheY-like chemotaxis protein
VQGLTQEATAERLGITPRHLRRCQCDAIKALADSIWSLPVDLPGKFSGPEAGASSPEATDWVVQMREELACLQRSAPGATADVCAAVEKTMKLARPLMTSQGVALTVERIPPGLTCMVHASLLHQVLIAAISRMAQAVRAGQIQLRAHRDDVWVVISATVEATAIEGDLNAGSLKELLVSQGGALEVDVTGDALSLRMALPAGDDVPVLVVDDNPDLVHFYQRYTSGTRYRVLSVAEGKRTFEMVEGCAPRVIVLDVMLPDIDGWELLMDLRQNPATSGIPCVVCSVIQEEELALALGASVYLPKPVRRQQFIQALDQALSSSLEATAGLQ